MFADRKKKKKTTNLYLHGSCHFFIIIINHAKPLVLGYFRFHERIRFSDSDYRAIMRLQVHRSIRVRSLQSSNLEV